MPFWGNKYASNGYSYVKLDASGKKYSARFTAQENKTVNSVRFRTFINASPPTYRVGLQADSGGVPSGTFLGSGTITPSSTANWFDVILDVPVTLIVGNVYHMVIQYETGAIGPVKYIQVVHMNDNSQMYPIDCSTDVQLNYIYNDGTGWTAQNKDPVFLLVYSDSTYRGITYHLVASLSVYGLNECAEKFRPTTPYVATALKAFIYKVGTPPDSLTIEIYNLTNNYLMATITVSASEVGTSIGWITKTHSRLYFDPDNVYRFRLRSPNSDASNYYALMRYTTAGEIYADLSWRGINDYYSSSSDGGVNWTDNTSLEINFQFDVTDVESDTVQGFIPLSEPQDITPTAGSWQEVNVSSYVGESANMAILLIQNTNAANAYADIRAKNTTFDDYGNAKLTANSHQTALSYLTPDKKFEAKIDSNVKIYLIGYADWNVVLRRFRANYTPSTALTWETKTVNEPLTPSTLSGVILKVINSSAADVYAGVRKTGSTDTINERIGANMSKYFVIGTNPSKQFDVYLSSLTNVACYLIGYIRYSVAFSNFSFFTTGIQKTFTVTGWTIFDLSTNVPSGTKFVMIQALRAAATSKFYPRRYGSTTDLSANSVIYYHQHFICPVDASRKIECYSNDTLTVFYLIGYSMDIKIEKAGLTTTIDPPSTITLSVSNEWKEIDFFDSGCPHNTSFVVLKWLHSASTTKKVFRPHHNPEDESAWGVNCNYDLEFKTVGCRNGIVELYQTGTEAINVTFFISKSVAKEVYPRIAKTITSSPQDSPVFYDTDFSTDLPSEGNGVIIDAICHSLNDDGGFAIRPIGSSDWTEWYSRKVMAGLNKQHFSQLNVNKHAECTRTAPTSGTLDVYVVGYFLAGRIITFNRVDKTPPLPTRKADKVWAYNANTNVYTDETDDFNSAAVNDVALPPMQTTTLGDAIYLGNAEQLILRLYFVIGTLGVYSGITLKWQYWNGTTWTDLTNVSDLTNGFKNAEGTVTYDKPTNWAKNTVNGYEAYWIRCVVTAWTSPSLTTAPLGNTGYAQCYVEIDCTSFIPSTAVLVFWQTQSLIEELLYGYKKRLSSSTIYGQRHSHPYIIESIEAGKFDYYDNGTTGKVYVFGYVETTYHVSLMDLGNGADNINIQSPIPITDNGAGSDDIGIKAQIPLSDSGIGSDLIQAISTQVALSDSGGGSDSVAAQAQVPVADSGNGTDQLSSLSTQVPLSDLGSGADAIGLSAQMSISDAGSGVDAIQSLGAQIPISDAGSGVDSVTKTIPGVEVSVGDVGTGAEIIGVEARLTLNEFGNGADAIQSLNAQIPLSDSSSGVDNVAVFQGENAISVGDIGSGNDFIGGLINQTALSDSGSGLDVQTIEARVSVNDSGLGVEGWNIQANFSLSEGASGVDDLIVLREGIISISDIGSGQDAIGISKAFTLADYAVGLDVITITTPTSVFHFIFSLVDKIQMSFGIIKKVNMQFELIE